MEQINLPKLKPEIMKLAHYLYHQILDDPDRPSNLDTTPRTGFAFSMNVLPRSRNCMVGIIHEPSDAARQLSIAKSVYSELWGDTSSYNHRNPDILLFGGSVTVNFDGNEVQAAGSGLAENEDIAVMLVLQAYANKRKVRDIYANVIKGKNGKPGQLPDEFINKGYLNKFLLRYDIVAFDEAIFNWIDEDYCSGN